LHPQHQGFRATINSYLYGDALAIAHLADLAGQDDVAREYRAKAAKLKQLVLALNPLTGDWISRTRLKSWKNGTWDAGKGGEERGKDYNHSTFCDLVITGLIGLRPRSDQTVEVNPLVPEGRWDWFCLDHVPYHGRMLTILYDRTGTKYGRGQGLQVLADGKQVAASDKLTRVTGELSQVSR
jgi:hypothetical protein